MDFHGVGVKYMLNAVDFDYTREGLIFKESSGYDANDV